MAFITFGVILFIVLYVLLILYFFSGWAKLSEYIPASLNLTTKVSVIIPVRNEENNIVNILDDMHDQQYPDQLFEVIIIDDFSTDQTVETIRRYPMKNLRIILLKEIISGTHATKANKKTGIEKAIEQATGELIVTTDADCRIGSNWLNTIVSYYEEKKPVMIAGMVNYYPDSTFLGKFQTLDFLSLVGIAAASIHNGFYNLCNGANLAYTKEAFIAVGGFENIDHIASGDDMMLMHKMAKKFPGKIGYLKNKDSIVFTQTEKDFISFWNQRVRWTSKSVHYEDKRITIILSFVYLTNLLIIVDLIIGLFYQPFLKLAMWQFLSKLVIDTIFAYSVTKFFRRENLLWLFLPMQMVHIIYVLLIAPAGVFGKYQWKGRKV
ncbi:MAG: glycosyltransferase [Chitinophagales bacterium]